MKSYPLFIQRLNKYTQLSNIITNAGIQTDSMEILKTIQCWFPRYLLRSVKLSSTFSIYVMESEKANMDKLYSDSTEYTARHKYF